MNKFFTVVDGVIRLPLHIISYLYFFYVEIPEYIRDRIQLILLAIVLSTIVYWSPWVFKNQFEQFDSLFSFLKEQMPDERGGIGGFFYEYQALLSGFLAIVAGTFVVFSSVFSSWFEGYKARREITIRIRAWCITTGVEVCSILNSTNPLKHYNVQTLPHRVPTFLKKDFYWCLKDCEAYKAAAIENKVSNAVRAFQSLENCEQEDNKIIYLDLALSALCSALQDANSFMVSPLSNYLLIEEYIRNPCVSFFAERNKSPVRSFVNTKLNEKFLRKFLF